MGGRECWVIARKGYNAITNSRALNPVAKPVVNLPMRRREGHR
jgi:hypothetical protein